HQRRRRAESARDCALRPWPESNLTDFLGGDDLQVGAPEATFLFCKSRLDLAECARLLTQGHARIVAWPGQPEILLKDVRRPRLGGRHHRERDNNSNAPIARVSRHAASPSHADQTVTRAQTWVKGQRLPCDQCIVSSRAI